MNEFIQSLNLFIGNVLGYTIIAIIYSVILYNVAKFIFYVFSSAIAHIRRDINNYKSNKNK